jgi:hypothetical protein
MVEEGKKESERENLKRKANISNCRWASWRCYSDEKASFKNIYIYRKTFSFLQFFIAAKWRKNVFERHFVKRFL